MKACCDFKIDVPSRSWPYGENASLSFSSVVNLESPVSHGRRYRNKWNIMLDLLHMLQNTCKTLSRHKNAYDRNKKNF